MTGIRLDCIYGLYPTPIEVVELMTSKVGGVTRTDNFLEPSAGTGTIAEYIRDRKGSVTTVEPHPELASILKSKGFHVENMPFEEFVTNGQFNKIIMNPPFKDGMDRQHIIRSFNLLQGKGTVVSLLSRDLAHHTKDQSKAFLDWLVTEESIEHFELFDLPQELFLSDSCERKSTTPMSMVTIFKC